MSTIHKKPKTKSKLVILTIQCVQIFAKMNPNIAVNIAEHSSFLDKELHYGNCKT